MSSDIVSYAIRQVSCDMATHVKESDNPAEQEVATETICALRVLAKLVREMTFEEAKATVLEMEDPERTRITDLLGSKGIFL